MWGSWVQRTYPVGTPVVLSKDYEFLGFTTGFQHPLDRYYVEELDRLHNMSIPDHWDDEMTWVEVPDHPRRASER